MCQRCMDSILLLAGATTVYVRNLEEFECTRIKEVIHERVGQSRVSISAGHIGRDKIVVKVGKWFHCKIKIFHKILYIKLTSVHCQPFRSSLNVSKMCGYYIVTCRGKCSVREESWGIWVHEDQGSNTRVCRAIPGVSISGRHIGCDKTVAKVGARFYWPNYTRDLRKYCASCHECQVTANTWFSKATPSLHPVEVPEEAWTQIG